MRILTLTSLFPNSMDPVHGIFVYRRVAAVAQINDIEVEVIAPVPFMPSWIKVRRLSGFGQVPASELIGALSVHHPRYPLLPKISMPLHGFLIYLGIRKLARSLHAKKPFDCIDAHYVYPDGLAATLVGRLLHIPVIISARGTDINLFPTFPTIRPMIRWTLENCDGIVAVSKLLKQRMVDLGLPESKIQIIGNGVDTSMFYPRDRRQARRSLGLPENGTIVVSIASLSENKGHQHIVAALAKIAAQNRELRLYLVGEGPCRAKIEEMVQQLSLKERVFLVGSRSNDQIPAWFNAADLSILASAREGWPNVILESLACGTPVVATSAGEIPEILGCGDLGAIAERNGDALAAAMQATLARQWDREALAAFARRRPWSAVGEEVEQYLAKLVGPTTRTGKRGQ